MESQNNNFNAETDLLSAKEVARYLDISRVTLWRIIHYQHQNNFPNPVKIMATNRYLKSDIDNWIIRQTKENRGKA